MPQAAHTASLLLALPTPPPPHQLHPVLTSPPCLVALRSCPRRPARLLSLPRQINAAQRLRLAAYEQSEADKVRIVKAAEADAEAK